uniref:hypothetical protein n=1 Tax=Flavobacterium sp. TaxID=239 RepID=UPI00404ABB47
MKKLIIILSTLMFSQISFSNSCYACDLEKVVFVSQNLDGLDAKMIHEFLQTFDASCKQNIEFSEFSNETLFKVLEYAPALFLQVIERDNIDAEIILEAIQNPINDSINLQQIYDKIKATNDNSTMKKKCLIAFVLAAEKSGLKLER